ncbi:hypothetical protein Syun_009824 [Stephania yunnanensis]|uniref:Uncharacterized protein n=1 Tax=Stephania yunnanensis TaxID=152371 RepID=A0AAP0KHW1_9MAGN
MDGQLTTPQEIGHPSGTARDSPVAPSMEDRLSAQETRMVEVLWLLRDQTAALRALAKAVGTLRELVVVMVPTGTVIVLVAP